VVKALVNNVFSAWARLVEVRVEAACASIGADVFAGCTALGSVSLLTNADVSGNADLLKDLPLRNFQISTSMTNLKLTASQGRVGYVRKIGAFCPVGAYEMAAFVTEIDPFAFSGCASVESIAMDANVRVISEGAFANCTALRKIAIPSGVVVVGDALFAGCAKLETIRFECPIISLGSRVFDGCGALKMVVVPSTLRVSASIAPNGTDVVTQKVGDRCPDGKDVAILPLITRIGEKSFANCVGISNLTVSGSVSKIDTSAFQGCKNLSIVTFAKDSRLEVINSTAFGSIALTTVTLPWEGYCTQYSSLSRLIITHVSHVWRCTGNELVRHEQSPNRRTDRRLAGMVATARDLWCLWTPCWNPTRTIGYSGKPDVRTHRRVKNVSRIEHWMFRTHNTRRGLLRQYEANR